MIYCEAYTPAFQVKRHDSRYSTAHRSSFNKELLRQYSNRNDALLVPVSIALPAGSKARSLLPSTTSISSDSDGGSSTSDDSTDSSKAEMQDSASTSTSTSSGNGIWSKGRKRVQQLRQSIASMYKTNESDEKITFRQRLAKMGLATILSYGFVSNMSYAITVSCAWYIHNVQNKASPLGPGQWKPFLIIYSGFWIFNNIVRPLRLGISIAVVAPQFDRILNYIQTQYQVSRTVAIAITVFMANVVGTISAMSIGIVIASILSGVPIFP
jgi:hypothetical protein